MTYKAIDIYGSDGKKTENVDSVKEAVSSLDNYCMTELLTFEGSTNGRTDYNPITDHVCDKWLETNAFHGTEDMSLELLNETQGPIPKTILNYMENNGWHNYDDGSDNAHDERMGD